MSMQPVSVLPTPTEPDVLKTAADTISPATLSGFTLGRHFFFFIFGGPMGSTRRFAGLDGLRGVAAAVVVMHHSLLVSPALAAAYGRPGAAGDIWETMLIHSPLHLLWAGPEAVIVFFLLSGFVLTLPVIHAPRFSWRAYFPKRLIRLYIPVAAAVALALVLSFVVPRNSSAELSWWINSHDRDVGLGGIAREVFLLAGTGRLNSPLWSLRWEVFFSLTLPLYVYLGTRAWGRRYWLPNAVGLIVLSETGRVLDSPALMFLPMFGVGVLMAANQDSLLRWMRRVGGWGSFAITAGSLLLLTSPWYVPGLAGTVSPALLSGCGLLLVCIASKRADALGSLPAVHWLGSRSFSLYLVHEPLIVSTAVLLQSADALQVMALAVPASLLLSEVFFRLVEDPSRRLANRVGQKVTRTVGSPPPRPAYSTQGD